MSDRKAPVLFISSPAGWNWAKELYDDAYFWKGWERWQYTTADGGMVDDDELEAAKAELDPRTYRQEYLASFEQLSNRVYSYFDRSRHVTTQIADPSQNPELHIGIDFNISPITAVIGVKAGGDQLHIIDEIKLENSNTRELAQAIQNKYPNHTITAYPDPSGKARKTSAVGGTTDFTILEDFNFRVVAPKAAPAVSDRINEVQRMLENADNQVRLYIHPRCQHLIDSLDGLTYHLNAPDKSSGYDHMTDALGYLIHSLFPIRRKIGAIPLGGVIH